MLIRASKSLSLPVPQQSNFRIPEGQYRAKIVSVGTAPVEKLDSTGQNVKLVFEVQVPSLPKLKNLATAKYKADLNSGSELRNVVTRLLGAKIVEDAAGGELSFDPLEGMEVDIEIEHITTNRRDEYDYPLVKVRNIQPSGTLVVAKAEQSVTGGPAKQ